VSTILCLKLPSPLTAPQPILAVLDTEMLVMLALGGGRHRNVIDAIEIQVTITQFQL
jgi:hypothetical protein